MLQSDLVFQNSPTSTPPYETYQTVCESYSVGACLRSLHSRPGISLSFDFLDWSEGRADGDGCGAEVLQVVRVREHERQFGDKWDWFLCEL